MLVLHGIKNCDTVKKARHWLDSHAVPYHFHDFRVDGLSETQLRQFLIQVDWQTLLNKSSSSWRQLTAQQQSDLTSDKAIALMLAQPTLIKRPVLQTETTLIVGFKPDAYAAQFL